MDYDNATGTVSIDIEPVAPNPVSNDDLLLIGGVAAGVLVGLALLFSTGKRRKR